MPDESTSLPGYFVRPKHAASPAPTLLHLNGYDSNIQEMYFAHAPAAVRRGYNCPAARRTGARDATSYATQWCFARTPRPSCPSRSTICSPVPEVDPQRIVLAGWGFGGYLAPRAAAHEKRIAALIADPGLWDQKVDLGAFRLPPDLARQAEAESKLDCAEADQLLRWRIFQRGVWVHGVSSLRGAGRGARAIRNQQRGGADLLSPPWSPRPKAIPCPLRQRPCTRALRCRRNCCASRPPKVPADTARPWAELATTSGCSTGWTKRSGTPRLEPAAAVASRCQRRLDAKNAAGSGAH